LCALRVLDSTACSLRVIMLRAEMSGFSRDFRAKFRTIKGR
jgi:hypothetical protein